MKTIRYFLLFAICLLVPACGSEKHDQTDDSLISDGTDNIEKEEISCDEYEFTNYEFKYEAYIQDLLECMNMPRPADSYNYPVYPCMEEWKSFRTGQEMEDACQVHVCALDKLSTQALIQAIWESPFIMTMYAHDDQRVVPLSFLRNNNAGVELLKRSDAGKGLYERLIQMSVSRENIRSRAIFDFLCIFISHEVFLSQLSTDEMKTLIITMLNNVWLQDDTDFFLLRPSTAFLTARILLSANYAPFVDAVNNNDDLKSFLYSSSGYIHAVWGVGNDITQYIIEFGKQFIEN